jgi:hypothetical protein
MDKKTWEEAIGDRLVFVYQREDGRYNFSIRGMDLGDIRLFYESLETAFPLCKSVEKCLERIIKEEKP